VVQLLLVDDDPEVRELLSYALRGSGYDVVVAEDGVFALALLKSDPPDLMLLDLDMPGLTGEAFVAACRRTPRWANVPVLLLSGREDVASVAVALGAAGYLQKPYRVNEVRRMIRALTDQLPRAKERR